MGVEYCDRIVRLRKICIIPEFKMTQIIHLDLILVPLCIIPNITLGSLLSNLAPAGAGFQPRRVWDKEMFMVILEHGW